MLSTKTATQDKLGYGKAGTNTTNMTATETLQVILSVCCLRNNQIEFWLYLIRTNAADGDGAFAYGTKNLSTFVAEADLADLDDQLIVLYAAGVWPSKQAVQTNWRKRNHYARLKQDCLKQTVLS